MTQAAAATFRVDCDDGGRWFLKEGDPDGDGNSAGAAARAYDHHGRLFSWQPRMAGIVRAAIDVEATDSQGHDALRRRYGLAADEFLQRWTATEVVAKLLDQPVLSFLRSYGLVAARFEWHAPALTLSNSGRAPQIWLCNIATASHWIALGYTRETAIPWS